MLRACGSGYLAAPQVTQSFTVSEPSAFAAPISYPVGVNPRVAAVGDFNHDGILDVAAANGGSGKPIGVAEMNPKRTHRLGAVAMAHAGDPRNADSQMYVTLAPTPRLDGDYTVFGQVIAGMDVVQKIQVGDVIRRATVKGAAPATKE